MNDAENTVKWITLAAENKFRNLETSIINDKDFDPVRNSDIFARRVMLPGSTDIERTEGWKNDLSYMKTRMEQTHFDIFRVVSKEKWDKMFVELERNSINMDDARIFTEMLKITSSIGDGHTTIFPGDNTALKLYSLPVQFYLFEEGLYITLVSPEHKELAGKKVARIGNSDINDALKKITEVISADNEIWYKNLGPVYLTYNSILYGLGITPKEDEAEITFDSGEKILIKSELMQSQGHNREMFGNWVKARDTINPALCYKNRSDLYWFQYLPESKMVYMQLNGTADKDDEKLSQFSKRVMEFIKSSETEFFVLDIRFNGGGNNFLNKALVQEIIKCEKINKKGKFFTITGRSTFSAAMNLCNDLERQTSVIFVGEPTGSSPNFVGETNFILLPNSRLRISCSSRYWQGVLSDDQRKWIAPQLGVKYFYSDFEKGIDPSMDAIMEFIKK
jgi:hypothetical protein